MTPKIPGLHCKCHWNRLMVESAEKKTVIRDKAICFLKVFLTCLQILTYDVIASERQIVYVFNQHTHNFVLLKFAQLGLEMTVTRRPIQISD